jgi:hypothetical protein
MGTLPSVLRGQHGPSQQSGVLRELRVQLVFGLACTKDRPTSMPTTPWQPSSMKRSCHRHTAGFDMPVRRMISFVPWPSAVASTILARQIALALLLRSLMMASSRARFERLR